MKNRFCYVAVMLFLFVKVNAQVSVMGKITDNRSQPLGNVTVHLLNTQVAAISNSSGDFSIRNIAPGKYIIQFSSIGYAAAATEIELKTGSTNAFNFQLQNNLVQLEAVTVTAQKKEELLQKIPVHISKNAVEYGPCRFFGSCYFFFDQFNTFYISVLFQVLA